MKNIIIMGIIAMAIGLLFAACQNAGSRGGYSTSSNVWIRVNRQVIRPDGKKRQ